MRLFGSCARCCYVSERSTLRRIHQMRPKPKPKDPIINPVNTPGWVVNPVKAHIPTPQNSEVMKPLRTGWRNAFAWRFACAGVSPFHHCLIEPRTATLCPL